MEYLTTYYRQQGEEGCSLLLQQYLCRQVPVCFACLCTAEGEEGSEVCKVMIDRFLGWCRKVPWHRAAKRPAAWLERFEAELTDLSKDCVKLTLLLGIAEEILVLGGGQNIILLNTSFGKGKATGLPGQFRGCLESGAGLLLATDGFMKKAEGKGLEEALRLSEIRTAEQAERHLKEIAAPVGPTKSIKNVQGKESVSEEPVAAILLVGRGGDCVYK